MFRWLIVSVLVFLFCSPVSAHRLRWTETAQEFIDRHKVEIVFYPEELISNIVSFDNCLECLSFEKTHNIEAYKNHLDQVQYWIDYDKRYTYTRYYVGYEEFRSHIAKYHKDKNYIMTQVYVNPTEYRTQSILITDAQNRKDVLRVGRYNLNEHIKHIRNRIKEYLK